MPSRRIEELALALQPLCLEFLTACEAAGLTVTVCQTYRSPEYQKQLVSTGASRITNSLHCRTLSDGTPAAMAFDCMALRNGKLVQDGSDPVYTRMGHIWESIGLKYGVNCTWGGRFTHPDPDHFSLNEGRYVAKEVV